MHYAIQALVLHGNPRVPITDAEFVALRNARVTLKAAFTLEEIYDLLLGNFHELAVSALEAAVSEMTKWRETYEEHFEVRAGFNRRTLNLLSASRLYLDQYPQWLKEVGADPASVQKLSNELYDTHFEYRFMEALRNHAQHVGHAVHGVNYNTKWLPPKTQERMQFSVSPYVSRTSLASDAGFKSAVLAECPDKVPIIPVAHIYVGALSKLHQEVRRLSDPLSASSRALVQSAITRHKEAAQEKIPGLTAIAFDGERITEEVPLFLEWDDVRLKLASKNRTLSTLGKSYVSSLPDDTSQETPHN
jgi:hypothetical protein